MGNGGSFWGSLTVHLEKVHVECGQIELPLAPPQEKRHVFPQP